jgi:WD40 repeat protein
VASNYKWTDALLRGELPLSTRVSGTIVLIGFVLLAQWHFFDGGNPMKTLSRLPQFFWADHKLSPSPSTVLAVDINQARTPTAWLRLQDHETAREVINVIKPNSHSLIARVYHPLILVIEGSNRTLSRRGVRPLLPAAYDFVKYQSTRFIMTVLFIVAAVSLLMNLLLWGEDDPGTDNQDDRPQDETLLAVKSWSNGHALDILILAASPDGVIVSIGLDRLIRVWHVLQNNNAHMVEVPTREIDIFPVLAVAIDEKSNWLALLSANGNVILWHIPTRKWGPVKKLNVRGRSPLIFSFASSKTRPVSSVLCVQLSGILIEMMIESDGTLDVHEQDMHSGTLACACLVVRNGRPLYFIASRHFHIQ